MKHCIQYTVMAACVSLAPLPVLGDQTNLVQNLEFSLVGIAQGRTTTVKNVTTATVDTMKLATDDIITAIGSATGNNFSPQAELVVITPVPSGADTVAIRDGGKSVDVTVFFTQSPLSQMVGSYTYNSKTGKGKGTNYGIQQFTLQDSTGFQPLALHYTVSGTAVENVSVPEIPGPRAELRADVSGTGDSDGNLLIIQGTIRIFGQQVEVAPGGGPAT